MSTKDLLNGLDIWAKSLNLMTSGCIGCHVVHNESGEVILILFMLKPSSLLKTNS